MLIVDFVRANLVHAQRMLGPLVGVSAALMHADATSLPFSDGAVGRGFDGVWTVQVFQHIPDFAQACREAHRVLKPGGRFVNYSLHATPLNRLVHRLMRKPYHVEEMVGCEFHLTRANDRQQQIVADVFGAATDRYTECLFHPDLKLTFTRRPGSVAGKLDARLGDFRPLARLIARQRSYVTVKL